MGEKGRWLRNAKSKDLTPNEIQKARRGISKIGENLKVVTEEAPGVVKGLMQKLGTVYDDIGGAAKQLITSERGSLSVRSRPKGVDPNHHNANVTVRNAEGEIIRRERIVSGNMTAEERALPFPQNTLSSHTEARAVREIPLEEGQTMTITGQRPPCPSCKGKINKAAEETGGDIRYQWREEGKTKKWPPGDED